MIKYSMEEFDAETSKWERIAVFSDIIPLHVLADMGRIMWKNMVYAKDVAVMDIFTGEVLWRSSDDTWQDEPAWIDDDCGFDPYLGCYSDDV